MDETPIPEDTLNFEIPDADALVYSTGLIYHPGKQTRIALAYLLSKKKAGKSLILNPVSVVNLKRAFIS